MNSTPEYLPEWMLPSDRSDPRWRVLWGCLGQSMELGEWQARRLWGWYVARTPAGGRNSDRYDIRAQLEQVSPEQAVWAVSKCLAYQRPLTKRGKPSHARAVEVRMSFQSAAQEWVAGEVDHEGPLSARQLLRAVQWWPMPDDVKGKVRAVLSDAVLGVLWPSSVELMEPAHGVSVRALGRVAVELGPGAEPVPWAEEHVVWSGWAWMSPTVSVDATLYAEIDPGSARVPVLWSERETRQWAPAPH